VVKGYLVFPSLLRNEIITVIVFAGSVIYSVG